MSTEYFYDVTFSSEEMASVIYALKQEVKAAGELISKIDVQTSDLPYRVIQTLVETQMCIKSVIPMMEGIQSYGIEIPEGVPSDGAEALQGAPTDS